MQCTEFRNYAAQWMEGERAAEARLHMEACPGCRGLVTDLEAISATAGDWGAELPEPPARIWTALRAQLEQEGVIREPAAVESGPENGWFAGLFSFVPRPALAGAYLALLLIAGGVVAFNSAPQMDFAALPAFESPGAGVVPAQLNRAERRVVRAIGRSNPAVAASYREGLAIVDNFIALCEKTVREEPGNELARDYLYGAYQQKAELLANMLDRGVIAE